MPTATNRPATNGLDEDQLLAAGASLAPEMIEFVPASSSPTGGDLLLVSNEGSSTLSIYSVQPCGPGNSGAGGRRNLA